MRESLHFVRRCGTVIASLVVCSGLLILVGNCNQATINLGTNGNDVEGQRDMDRAAGIDQALKLVLDVAIQKGCPPPLQVDIRSVERTWHIQMSAKELGDTSGNAWIVEMQSGQVTVGDCPKSQPERRKTQGFPETMVGALRIAHRDASEAYRTLDSYAVRVVDHASTLVVEYYLKDPRAMGGGPRYVIDAKSLTIMEREYLQ